MCLLQPVEIMKIKNVPHFHWAAHGMCKKGLIVNLIMLEMQNDNV